MLEYLCEIKVRTCTDMTKCNSFADIYKIISRVHKVIHRHNYVDSNVYVKD